MFILRTGKSLSNCSNGYFYKVVATDSKTITFLDNNGKEAIARKNSDKWDFNPKCEINQAKIGSKEPEAVTKSEKERKSNSYNSSSSSDFTTGLIVGSFLF